jgi:phosphatidylinositol alpha-1,6-mannosyltransferase
MNHGEPRRKRILFVCTEVCANGGIQRFNRTLLTALAELEVACDVYSLADTEATVQQWPAFGGTSIRPFARNKHRFATHVIGALLTGRYEYVLIGHVHFATLIMLALALRLARAPRTILVTHGTDVWTGISGMRRRAVRTAHRILCVSRYTKSMMQAQAPELQDGAFAIFPNALSQSWVEQAEAESAGAPPHTLPDRFILSVSRLNRVDRTKGIITVIEAAALLDPTVHYVIAGHGNDMDFLRGVAERCGVAHRVHFLGSVADKELVRLYAQCAAFVLPSSQEGFGIVFLEAMYFGAPVIAAREKGAVDVVRDGETGLLVEYGDAVALSKTIEKLLADAPLRQYLRAGARTTVTADGEFTFRAFVRRCAAVLEVPPPAEPSVSVATTAPTEEPTAFRHLA